MQLRNARLCLNCEEIHDHFQCPACGSEPFAYVTQWIPALKEPVPPQRSSTEVERVQLYQRLLGSSADSTALRWTKRGAWGFAATMIAVGWWRKRRSGDLDETGLSGSHGGELDNGTPP